MKTFVRPFKVELEQCWDCGEYVKFETHHLLDCDRSVVYICPRCRLKYKISHPVKYVKPEGG
jgi:hypothetical protein